MDYENDYDDYDEDEYLEEDYEEPVEAEEGNSDDE